MKFRHNQTGQIFNSEWELRHTYPNVSFPAVLDQNALNYADVSNVIEVPPPQITELQRVEYDGILLINNQWTESWSIHPRFDDPVEQAAWEAEVLDAQWTMVKTERNRLLAETDYTDLPNTPITAECRANFITYRQALRDITQTQTDPYNIIWPTVPVYETQP